MAEPAAIRGTFVNYQPIHTRKVFRLFIEVPIEEADAALAALGGTPHSGRETWVAVARLSVNPNVDVKANGVNAKVDEPKRRFSELPPAQQAALTCQREAFWKFIAETQQYGVQSEDDAAGFVREWCAVRSRSDLNTNPAASEAWLRLLNEFNDWLRLPTF